MMIYTLVRHTGFSFGGNPQFEHAVEERSVDTAKQRGIIARAGGPLYPSYREASKMAHIYNYPPEVSGLIPNAKGKFVKRVGFDEEIFIPDRWSSDKK